jgi:hypothetical protein
MSMVKHIAPRNIVLLQSPRADPLLSRLNETLSGLFCRVHSPDAGAVVPLPATAVFVADLTAELSKQLEAAHKVHRPPYHLGWLDGIVTGAPLQRRLLSTRIIHTTALFAHNVARFSFVGMYPRCTPHGGSGA